MSLVYELLPRAGAIATPILVSGRTICICGDLSSRYVPEETSTNFAGQPFADFSFLPFSAAFRINSGRAMAARQRGLRFRCR